MARGKIGPLFPDSIPGTMLFLLFIVLVPGLLVQAAHYYTIFQTRRDEGFQANLEVARARVK